MKSSFFRPSMPPGVVATLRYGQLPHQVRSPDGLLLGAGQQFKGRGKRGDGGHQQFEGFVIAFEGGFAGRDELIEAGFPCHHVFKIRAVKRDGKVSLFRLLPLDGGQR
ncbi:hypothetical protein D3C85_1585480 [compost metagenome]